jgi:hypothetical protein
VVLDEVVDQLHHRVVGLKKEVDRGFERRQFGESRPF